MENYTTKDPQYSYKKVFGLLKPNSNQEKRVLFQHFF